MKYLLLLLSFSVNADVYIGGGIGLNDTFFSSKRWVNKGELGCVLSARYVEDIGNYRLSFGYKHFSQCLVGPPIDNRGESSLDHIGVMVEYRVY